jgi:hypothetical protein
MDMNAKQHSAILIKRLNLSLSDHNPFAHMVNVETIHEGHQLDSAFITKYECNEALGNSPKKHFENMTCDMRLPMLPIYTQNTILCSAHVSYIRHLIPLRIHIQQHDQTLYMNE